MKTYISASYNELAALFPSVDKIGKGANVFLAASAILNELENVIKTHDVLKHYNIFQMATPNGDTVFFIFKLKVETIL